MMAMPGKLKKTLVRKALNQIISVTLKLLLSDIYLFIYQNKKGKLRTTT